MGYQKIINPKEGWNYLSLIWTIFLSEEPDLFAEPFSNRHLRYRCLFVKEVNNIYLYLTNEEIKSIKCLNPLPSKIYFYGAYNQIEVCQMRSYGTIKVVVDKRRHMIIELMTRRLNGEQIISDNFCRNIKDNLNDDGTQKSLKSLSLEGKLYCFEPISYDFDLYERG